MAAKTDKTRFATDPYGIIERGVPGGDAASSFSVGRVGSPVESVVEPGRSFGSGVGGRLTIPIKDESPNIKKKAKGGKVQKKADGGLLDKVGRAISDMATEGHNSRYGIPKNSAKPARSSAKPRESGSDSKKSGPITVTKREETVTVKPSAINAQTVRPAAPKTQTVRLKSPKTQTVKLNAHKDGGKVQTSADTARKLATEMGGMKKGGKPKSGLAVMIAIGETKKPVKKAVGGVGKMRKGMMPEKLAKGGAGKVRKGMMTPEGKIIDVMNKIRGK